MRQKQQQHTSSPLSGTTSVNKLFSQPELHVCCQLKQRSVIGCLVLNSEVQLYREAASILAFHIREWTRSKKAGLQSLGPNNQSCCVVWAGNTRTFVAWLCKTDFRVSTKQRISCIFMESRTPRFLLLSTKYMLKIMIYSS